LDICSRLQPDLYVSKNNVDTVFMLLKNVATCFDTSRSDIKRYRQCSVLLGMKNSGKSVLVKTLQEAIQAQYPSSITILVESSELVNTTIAELVKKQECSRLGIGVDGTSLRDVLRALAKEKRSLLLVVDEAHDLYPKKDTHRKKRQIIQQSLWRNSICLPNILVVCAG
jgi:type II secretory pathway predicted ATPase ExeA